MNPFPGRLPVIGMVHLRPLPGSPRYGGSLEAVFRAAWRDAGILIEEGLDGILLENYGDLPFLPAAVTPETTAALAVLLHRLRERVAGRVVWGVNVLRNDARAATAIAAAAGGSFIRVNLHLGAAVTDQGILQGMAHETIRLRAVLAPRLAIWADANVKHADLLGRRSLPEEVRDLVERGLADAVLITGRSTGHAPDPATVEEARRAAGRIPVIVASGVDPLNVGELLPRSSGIIVGTSLKRGGRTEAPIDRTRVRALMAAVRRARRGA